MRALLLIAALIGVAIAQNNTFTCNPSVFITPPLPSSKLLLTNLTLNLDLSAGRFYLDLQTTFSGPLMVGVLPLASLNGNVAFQAPGLIFFSFPDDGDSYCHQASTSSPSLCPDIMRDASGPFVFAAHPSSPTVATTQLLISSSTSPPPGLQTSLNFLGAQIPLTLTCSGTCQPIGSQVPSYQRENVTYTVCRFLPEDLQLTFAI